MKDYDLAALRARAAACAENGIDACVDTGMGYAFVPAPGVVMVADGRRIWRNPTLVQEIDILSEKIVTTYYYLKNVNMLPAKNIAKSGKKCVRPAALPMHMAVDEVVIFDHTAGTHRPVRAVIEGEEARM